MKTTGEVLEVHFEAIGSVTVDLIAKAKTRVLVASYTQPSPSLSARLADAAKRGVDVEGVISGTTCAQDLSVGFPCVRVDVDGGTMHSKFMVVDDKVLTGSVNFSGQSASKNVAVVLRGAVVKHFVAEHGKLMKLKPSGDLLRGDAAVAFVEAAAKRVGWDRFLTLVARRVRSRGWITPREKRAVENHR